MFRLFFKECKNISKDLVYIVYILIIIVFYITQYGNQVHGVFNKSSLENVYSWSDYSMEEPKQLDGIDVEKYIEENDTYPYGKKNDEVPSIVESIIFNTLFDEYSKGTYSAYPFGYIQHVKLDSDCTKRVEEILEEISGKSISNLKEIYKNEEEFRKLTGNLNFDYDRFKELMSEVNKMVGKGSSYDPNEFYSYSYVALSYEDAVREYNDFLNIDGISSGLARIFCDYMGIIVSLYPIFIVVLMFLKDKKNNIHEIIYSSKVTAFKLIINRYMAIVAMSILPVIVLAIISTGTLWYRVPSNLIQYFDYFSFIKYSLEWLLPSIMIVTSIGMIVTLITDGFFAIVLQILWWIYTMFNAGVIGKYALSFIIIRFNSIEKRQVYFDNINAIFVNRMFYSILSIILVILSVVVFKMKRKGRLANHNGYKRNFKISKN